MPFPSLASGGLGARLRGYRWTLEGLLLKAKIRHRRRSVGSFKAGRVNGVEMLPRPAVASLCLFI